MARIDFRQLTKAFPGGTTAVDSFDLEISDGEFMRPLSLFAPWVVLTVAMSIIVTWMYNSTGGSLLIVILFHAAANLPLTIVFEPLDDEITQPFLIYVGLMVLTASVVVVATGSATLSRSQARQVDVP